MAAPVLKLGGISLDPSMQWTDRDSAQRVGQSVLYTFGGIVVTAVPLEVGLEITLDSGADFGLLKTAVVDALEAIAAEAGSVFVLELNAQSWSVMFRHNDPPAFSAEPVVARLVPLPSDYFRCHLKLITV
jgi:hypothetical protein